MDNLPEAIVTELLVLSARESLHIGNYLDVILEMLSGLLGHAGSIFAI